MIEFKHAFTLFLSLVIESFPWLLLGIIVSSIILGFVNTEQLRSNIPKNPILQAILGSLLGLILPVCQYGNIPVTRRFLISGFPLAMSISFLIAAPTLNPVIIWLSWQTFSNHDNLAILRIILVWIMSLVIGLIFSSYREQEALIVHNHPENFKNILNASLLTSGTFITSSSAENDISGANVWSKLNYQNRAKVVKPIRERLYVSIDNAVRELIELGTILILGCAITTIGQILFPQLNISNLGVKIYTFTGILTLIGISILISLNSVVSTSIVSQFASSWISTSWLAFLLSGSIIDIKSLSLLIAIFKPKYIIYLSLFTLELTLLLTLCIDFYIF